MTKKQKETVELEELKRDLDIQKATIEEYTDHLKRLQAEFDNYMKRTEKERAGFISQATERIVAKLLLVVDDFEHALPNLPEDTKEGVQLIFKNLHKILEEEQVEAINATGKLDPYKHEVVLRIESQEPEDTIIEEIQKGYTMNGKVIRYAKVSVSKGSAGGTNNE